MKAIPCTHCRACPHWLETPYPTSDSWERAHYWWCANPDVEELEDDDVIDEIRRKQVKTSNKVEKIRKIAGYVEWHEEKSIKIPEFCPLKDI